jgi:hypothetical protein
MYTLYHVHVTSMHPSAGKQMHAQRPEVRGGDVIATLASPSNYKKLTLHILKLYNTFSCIYLQYI